MKVCFISPFAYSLFNTSATVFHGGAELDLYFIASELAKNPEFTVSFITGDFGQAKVEQYGLITLYKSFRTDVKGWWHHIYGLFIAIPKLFCVLRRADANIYVQEGAGIETTIIALFCRLTRKRFVYRVASTIDCNKEIIRLRPIMGRIFLFGMRRADAIITEDQEEAELIQHHYGLSAQAIYDTTPIPESNKIIPIEKRRHVLWVSRLVRMKRPKIYLQIAASYPNEFFILIAPPDPNDHGFTQEITKQTATLPNVHFIPGLKHNELDEFYRYAKLLVNTSDYEGYPNTFIEAGKYAVPVISLRVNPDGFLNVSRFGECVNGNVNTLIKTVGDWLNDTDRRERAGFGFRKYVEETNDIRKNITAYSSLFYRLIKPI